MLHHPLASEVPPLSRLVHEHEGYMSRLEEGERNQSLDLTSRLDVLMLRDIATGAIGCECVGMDKIYEGGFNQIYNLTFSNKGVHAIARVNKPFGGGSENQSEEQLRNRVRSEVATLKWLKKNTNIPVPHVLTYDDDPGNAVGAAYMIQERILGRPLSEVWASLLLGSRRKIIQQLARIQGELQTHSFAQIGSLYEDPQCSGFCVGPICTAHGGGMRDLMKERLQEIVSNPEKIRAERTFNGQEESNFDVHKFKALYEAILHLVNNVELLDSWDPMFCISHPDLTPLNILVSYEDPECIVGIVDWEGTRIQPWWQTCPSPDLLWVEDTLPEKQDGQEMTWEDVQREWHDIYLRIAPADVQSDTGFFLGRLDCLIISEFAVWASMEAVIDFVMEWRFKWPQPLDPAFAPLDCILQLREPASGGLN